MRASVSPPPPPSLPAVALPAITLLAVALLAVGTVGAAPLRSPSGATCRVATPFPPEGAPSGWKHKRHAWVHFYGKPNHRANDVVVNPGAPQRIIAKFAYGLVDKDLSDERVDVYVQDDPPCGPWRVVGSGLTSDDDEPNTRWGVEDDGGRLYFEIPAALAREPGRHPVRLRVPGDGSTAALTLYVVRPETGAVVFDIDGTLTTDDGQVVRQVLQKLRDREYVPTARDGAVDLTRAWAAQGYLPVYVTGRPDVLREITDEWLAGRGFPEGPVRLTDELGEALPSDGGVGAYKTRVLRGWLDDAHLAIAAAYGNARTDINAYRAAGLPLDRTYIVGPYAGEGGTQPVASYPKHLEALGTPPRAAVPAP